MPKSKKQVLFLSIDGMTDALGQSQVLPYLMGLKKTGWDVTLISAEKPNRFRDLGDKIKSLCSNAGIEWIPFIYRSGLPIISGIYNVWRLKQYAYNAQKSNGYTIVHCRSYLPGLIGLSLKSSYGLSFIFDIRGFWVDEKIDGHIWKINNPIHRLLFKYFKRKETELFNGADSIVSLTEKAKQTICEISANKNTLQKVEVIPCCVDTSHFNPELDWSALRESWKTRLGLGDNEKLLVYLGSLSTWYLPKEMLLFYKSFEKTIPGLRFLIVSSESPEPFRNMLKDLEISEHQVVFTSSHREELPALLTLAKYAICFYQSSFSRQATSPTKLAELMSLGIPIVCSNNVGDVNEIMSTTESGVVCDPKNPDTWTAAIQQLIHLSNHKTKTEIRKWAIQLFDINIGISRYNEIYKKLSHHP